MKFVLRGGMTVKLAWLVPVPFAPLLTLIGPVLAPLGTSTSS